MLTQIARLPFFVVLMGFGSISMLLPSAHGLMLDDFNTMRIFFYGTILFGVFTLLVGLATASYEPASVIRSQLLTLVASFTVLPVMFAIPFYEAIPGTTFLNAWFEMVSSFTTTGATVFDTANRLPPSLHLWRATVAWMGGFLVWVTALAILAPMNLGGFEVRAVGRIGAGLGVNSHGGADRYAPADRLARFAYQLLPIYAGLTAVLWLGLVSLGEFPYIALIHAMSVLSTSGITSIDGLYYAVAGFWGEVMMFVFFVFALSRLTYSSPLGRDNDRVNLLQDPEMKVAMFLVGGTTLLLVIRHFFGVGIGGETFTEFAVAAWGALFTVTSFLTTTGFESRFWVDTTDWAGVDAPGIFLLGLALIGGGVATTAGGAKLLRVYALYRHSEREMARLLHPSSIGGGGKEARQIRKQGAYISWVFFMLLSLSVALVMLLLSLTGVQFETSMILSVAALSTTGPLAAVAGEAPIAYSGLPDMAKVILSAAMVLGRLETLALIALFNPDFWRN